MKLSYQNWSKIQVSSTFPSDILLCPDVKNFKISALSFKTNNSASGRLFWAEKYVIGPIMHKNAIKH